MEATVPSKAVVAFVALILVLLAGFGAYQGWKRSSGGEQDAGEASALTAPLAGARTASALAEPSAPALTEAQVREIARQEARAALGKPEGSGAPTAGGGDASAPAASSAAPAAPAAAKPTTIPAAPRPAPTQPALQTPAAPAPAGETNQAPLF